MAPRDDSDPGRGPRRYGPNAHRRGPDQGDPYAEGRPSEQGGPGAADQRFGPGPNDPRFAPPPGQHLRPGPYDQSPRPPAPRDPSGPGGPGNPGSQDRSAPFRGPQSGPGGWSAGPGRPESPYPADPRRHPSDGNRAGGAGYPRAGRAPYAGTPGSGSPQAPRRTAVPGTPATRRPRRPVEPPPTAVLPGLAAAGGTPPPPAADAVADGREHPKRDNRRRALLATRIVAAVLSVALLAGAGVAWAFTGALQSNSGTSDAAANAGSGGVTFENGMTILLVGSDARTDADGNPLSAEELKQVGTEDDGGGINTDTMMLVHVPKGGGRATAVSLPRDTWISSAVTAKVEGPYSDGRQGQYAPNKLNSFYSTAKSYTATYLVNQGVTDRAQIERDSNEAGRTMLIKVIQAFSGMKIDHYAEVNLLGFFLLSNAIGGVPVCLNNAVDDPWSGAKFAAGPQEVQGTAALAFVRQRHGLPNSDLDRVKRQQAFLAGAADKILSVGTLTDPTKLTNLVGAVDRSVVFDKGFSVLDFAQQMTNLSSGNITFATLPTTGPEKSTNTDALATDPAQVKAFFASISEGDPTASVSGTSSALPSAAPTVDPSSVTVDVRDGTIADGVTDYVVTTVGNAGFTVGTQGVVPGTTSRSQTTATTVHYNPADGTDGAQQVLDTLGVGSLVADKEVAAGHVTVVVGTDLTVPSGLRAPGAVFLSPAPAGGVAAAQPAAWAQAASVPCVN
ncbi:hypothetical protein FDO65_15475 [Nakamurella flava]|uniref:LytR family transcriptional regulator n=1 Tax=Nakamurella flava TaxID=2576308 RepID=A0A4U6QFW4_9ACTN|nr:LCP family protein [Nakamurella flava]TKV58889.1 hypothetical protein FDO65_15475 [Nakamurella flava]